jgi:hypothetical protein
MPNPKNIPHTYGKSLQHTYTQTAEGSCMALSVMLFPSAIYKILLRPKILLLQYTITSSAPPSTYADGLDFG